MWFAIFFIQQLSGKHALNNREMMVGSYTGGYVFLNISFNYCMASVTICNSSVKELGIVLYLLIMGSSSTGFNIESFG